MIAARLDPSADPWPQAILASKSYDTGLRATGLRGLYVCPQAHSMLSRSVKVRRNAARRRRAALSVRRGTAAVDRRYKLRYQRWRPSDRQRRGVWHGGPTRGCRRHTRDFAPSSRQRRCSSPATVPAERGAAHPAGTSAAAPPPRVHPPVPGHSRTLALRPGGGAAVVVDRRAAAHPTRRRVGRRSEGGRRGLSK